MLKNENNLKYFLPLLGAFLIIWLLMMGLLGFPLLFLTLPLGYFSGKNVVDLWEAVPLFKGKL